MTRSDKSRVRHRSHLGSARGGTRLDHVAFSSLHAFIYNLTNFRVVVPVFAEEAAKAQAFHLSLFQVSVCAAEHCPSNVGFSAVAQSKSLKMKPFVVIAFLTVGQVCDAKVGAV